MPCYKACEILQNNFISVYTCFIKYIQLHKIIFTTKHVQHFFVESKIILFTNIFIWNFIEIAFFLWQSQTLAWWAIMYSPMISSVGTWQVHLSFQVTIALRRFWKILSLKLLLTLSLDLPKMLFKKEKQPLWKKRSTK